MKLMKIEKKKKVKKKESNVLTSIEKPVQHLGQ